MKDIESRFWSKVKIGKKDDCWEWQAATNRQGYGYFGFRGKIWKAHRVAWVLSSTQEPGQMMVRHKCDNPSCCNPNHLELGTAKDNAIDREVRNRAHCRKGSRNGRAKLCEDDVKIIKTMIEEGKSNRAIAALYDVSDVLISFIRHGKNWSHVNGPSARGR